MRALARHARLYSTCSSSRLLALLQRNPELSAGDARTELRWLRDAVRQRSPGVSSASGASDPDAALEAMVRRRGAGEPLQYILGESSFDELSKLTAGDTDFGPLTLLTRAPVLIPRPETAHVVEHLAALLPTRPLRVLDLCTGSGCIPLLLAALLPNVTAVGVDIARPAIELARDNIAHTGLGERVRVLQADILSRDFPELIAREVGPVDVVTANPPYIPREEWETLPASVREYEDPGALIAGEGEGAEGTAFYAHIAKIAPGLLRRSEDLDVRLAVEIGATQGKNVARILPGKTAVVQDQYGRDRMVTASVF